jgi:hypothetical protein
MVMPPDFSFGFPLQFPWTKFSLLALESSEVIGLRLMRLTAGGNDAHTEAQLMVSEKIAAGIEASLSLLGGSTPGHVVDRYREHVAANADRLSRK